MKRLNSIIKKYLAQFNKIRGDLWSKNVKMSVAFFIFPQCGDNDTSVATFVSTLVITLDTTGLTER